MFRSDEIRKEQTETPLYSEEARDAIYRIMMEKAQDVLRSGNDVLLDATFAMRAHREQARKLARGLDAKFTLLYLVCVDEVVKERLERRVNDASDAKFAQYLAEKTRFEAPQDIENPVVIDTSQDWTSSVEGIIFSTKDSRR